MALIYLADHWKMLFNIPGPLFPNGMKGQLSDFMANPRQAGPSYALKYGSLYRYICYHINFRLHESVSAGPVHDNVSLDISGFSRATLTHWLPFVTLTWLNSYIKTRITWHIHGIKEWVISWSDILGRRWGYPVVKNGSSIEWRSRLHYQVLRQMLP